MENIRQLPITIDQNGDLVIRRVESNEAIKNLLRMFEVFTESYAIDSEHIKKEFQKNGRIVGKLGEAVDMHTEKVETLDQTVGSFDERLTKAQLSNVASKIIRDDLQKDRHEKARQFVGNKVQLTFEAMEGTKNNLEQAVRDLIKKDTTKVMRQVTSYLKQQLGLKSIDDIPNCLVKKHKQLLKELTWKKLNNFTQKGGK